MKAEEAFEKDFEECLETEAPKGMDCNDIERVIKAAFLAGRNAGIDEAAEVASGIRSRALR